MRKVFKQIIAILLIIVLQLNSVCCINAADFQKYDSTQNETESNISIKGSSSYGDMIAEKVNNQIQQQQGNNCISNLYFSDNIATVSLTVERAAELVVAIYDENNRTKMLTASKTYVTVETTNSSLTIKQDEMPQYFIAKAFLLDCDSHRPLCEPFTTELYTKAICDLRKSEVDDYDKKETVLFNKNNNDNFGVYNDNTVVENENSTNIQIADTGNNTYTINNADSRFKSLKKGETFSYQYNNGSLLLVKVSSVSVKGNRVIIQGDDSADLADFFDYLKIDVDTSNNNASYDVKSNAPSATSSSGTPSEQINIEIPERSIDNISISGSLHMNATVSYYLVDDSILSPFEYINFYFKYRVEYTTKISGAKEFSKIPLIKKQEFPIEDIVILQFELNFIFKTTGKISFTTVTEGAFGVFYDNNQGFSGSREGPNINDSIKIEGDLYFGFEFPIGVSIINSELCYVGLKATPGFDFTASASYNSEVIHECINCICGELYQNISLSIEGSLFDIDIKLFTLEWTWNPHFSQTLFHTKTKITDLYWSLDYGDHGLTTCPHICYLVSVSVLDLKGLPVKDSKITVTNAQTGIATRLRLKDGELTKKTFALNTSNNGTTSFYLPNGHYTVNAKIGNHFETQDLTVENTYTDTIIQFKDNIDPTPTPTISPVPTITPTVSPVPIITPTDQDISSSGTDRNITWRLTKDGTLYISGTGKMPDYGYTYESPGNYVTIPAPWEEVKDKIKKAIIEEGICSVGNNAFNECTELLNIQLPSTITSIGESAFSLCTALKNITLPNKIQTVSANQFSGCSSLEKVVLPENLTRIEFQAFIHCYNLKEINMPEKLEYIGTWAFCNCKSLESISFSKYLTEISGEAFQDCVNLKQVVFAARKGSKKYPDMYITLSLGAFSGCKSLETITLEGVELLFSNVFSDCSNLREIYFTKNKPSISDNFLSGMDNVTVYYPTGDKTWNGIKSKTFGGKNVSWKAYTPDSVLQSSEANNASSSPETEFSDGKNENVNDFSSEEDTEQNENFSADNIQSNDSEDVDTVSVPEGKTQEVESSVNYERESMVNSGNYQTYTDRYPGSYCLFVAVKNKKADDILNPDNLLYIDQKTSDEKGTVSFSYTLKEAFNAPAFLVYGISAHTHSFNKWKTVSRATVFKPEVRQYICDICGMVEEREYGTKLKPVLKVSSSKVTLKVKQSTTGLKVTKMADGDSVVSWKSSNPKIVKVNKRGKLAAQGQTGKATVTVKLKSGISKKIAVTVQKNPVKTTKISGLKKTLSLQVGKRYTLKPILTPFTSSEKITYSSSNRRVVSISSKGIIKGLKRGTAKITVQSGKKKFIITVRVK